MALKFTSTKSASADNGLKFLIHGPAKIGKTTLASTTGAPTLIISAEGGLLSLREYDIPAIEITCWQDLVDAYNFVVSAHEAQGFRWIALDSISEIAEVCLAVEKAKSSDPRQAYGATQDKVLDVIRKFRNLQGKHVYFICKQGREKDEMTGATLYAPMMPGNKLGQAISFQFDEVFAMRLMPTEGGDTVRVLQTGRDMFYEAGDRSGALDMYEPANLAHIAAKILAKPAA